MSWTKFSILSVNTYSAIKSGNYLNNVLALNEAKRAGYDDCLMVCENGNLSECSRANIWLIFGDTIVTPIGNNLRGITRKQLHIAIGSEFKVQFLFRIYFSVFSTKSVIFKAKKFKMQVKPSSHRRLAIFGKYQKSKYMTRLSKRSRRVPEK